MKPGAYLLGKEFGTGNDIVLTVHEGPVCGRDCDCCGWEDGTVPSDHARDCDLITLADGEWSDCTCEGAQERAAERKREEE